MCNSNKHVQGSLSRIADKNKPARVLMREH